MKKLYSSIVILIAVSFAVTAIMLTLMPDQVPMHYNAAGKVDRIGSKYENFILPALAAVAAIIFIVIGKSRKNADEEKICAIMGIFMLLFFTALGVYFMYQGVAYVPGTAADLENNIFRFTFIAIGTLLVVLGNLMPKFRRNGAAGVRTPWSMSSDEVWQKSNRFGGITAVVCGLAMIICSAFISGTVNLIVNVILIVIWVIACIIASYKYYKAEQVD